MEPERRSVTLISSDGRALSGKFLLWEESPDDADRVRLTVKFGGGEITNDADDLFSALCLIRTELEMAGLIPRCYGSSRNVYPSRMSRGMGAGGKEYRLHPGRRGLTADLVEILDEGPDVNSVTVQTQENYYRAWLASLQSSSD